MAHTINERGLALIKEFEGCKLTAYRCPAGIPTIGYGTTAGVKLGMTITESTATEWLRRDIKKFEDAVNSLVKVKLNENQFSALVSFCYNVGQANLKSSTLLRLVNEGRFAEAAEQFERWNRAGGKVLNGLTRRRLAEKDLFLS